MSYTRLLYHLIFRPRYSRPAITEAHEKLLYHYIWGIVKAKGGVLYRIGGMPDHLHLLVQLPPTLSLSDFMHDLKLSTHYFLREHREEFPLFEGWGKSYGALTCSARDKERVTAYIQNQKEHHRTTTNSAGCGGKTDGKRGRNSSWQTDPVSPSRPPVPWPKTAVRPGSNSIIH